MDDQKMSEHLIEAMLGGLSWNTEHGRFTQDEIDEIDFPPRTSDVLAYMRGEPLTRLNRDQAIAFLKVVCAAMKVICPLVDGSTDLTDVVVIETEKEQE